jgi:NADPH:quinone reductase-like Zn-dependent oxidoreductase
MRTEAVVLRTHGEPEVLTRDEVDLPPPGPREVLVRVRAVALNHLDLWVRRGLPGLKLTYPHVLGSDVAGEVEALGPGARGVAIGARVVVSPGLSCGVCPRCLSGRDNLCDTYAILGEHVRGGYARHVVVPDTNVLPCPEGLSFTDAAAVPLVFLTAWQMLLLKARLERGQTVLVHAAGSGVSTAAIQIAKLYGARVIATTTGDTKIARARALGADVVVDRANQDFVAEVKKATGGRGADVVIDHVGGELLSASVKAAARGGCVVTCGATSGFRSEIDLRHVFYRQVDILGSTMGPKSALFSILEHVGRGELRPVVDRVLALGEATQAHRSLEAREVFGKIVLEVG